MLFFIFFSLIVLKGNFFILRYSINLTLKPQKHKTIGTLLLFFTILILISSSSYAQTYTNEEYSNPTFLADEMVIRSHHTTVDIYQQIQYLLVNLLWLKTQKIQLRLTSIFGLTHH